MNFPDALFSQAWAVGAFIVMALAWFWAARTAPWKRLADSGQSNVWLGTIVLLALMWSMKAGVKPGLNLHLLGVMMFTLMFGRQLALIGLSLVLAAVTLNAGLKGHGGWQAYALNALVLCLVPTLLADGIRRVVERFLPANFFIFIFVTAFFGAALTVVVSGAATLTLLWLAGIYPPAMLFEEHFPYYLLLGFAEAWLNGAMITLMVVYRPHWVGSFDDHRYFLNK